MDMEDNKIEYKKDRECEKVDKKISGTLLRVIYSVMELEYTMRYYGTDKILHYGEIHMIKEIKNNPGIHISAIAEMNGITRGAVSQMVKKLEKKGMVKKITDESNKSRILLQLTEKGEIAHGEHERFHRVFNEMLSKSLENFNEEEEKGINDFLDRVLEITEYFKIMTAR